MKVLKDKKGNFVSKVKHAELRAFEVIQITKTKNTFHVVASSAEDAERIVSTNSIKPVETEIREEFIDDVIELSEKLYFAPGVLK